MDGSVILVLVVLAVGGWFLWKHSQKKKASRTPSPVTPPRPGVIDDRKEQ